LAKKGGSRHLNRIAAPQFAAPERKTSVWLAKPMPGRHRLNRSVSLRALVCDWLELAADVREAERIIKTGKVSIDGRVARDSKMAVGLMDIISIPALEKSYLVLLDSKRRLKLKELGKGEGGTKLCRITGKRMGRGGKIVLTLHDGRALLADKSYRRGDSVRLKVPAGTAEGTLRLEPGARCLITGGRHAGKVAKLKELKPATETVESHATLEDEGGEIITLTEYLFVVGDAI
jgi:small subunit ribosomal protein S4e